MPFQRTLRDRGDLVTAALGLQIVGAKTRYLQELASGGGESEAGMGRAREKRSALWDCHGH